MCNVSHFSLYFKANSEAVFINLLFILAFPEGTIGHQKEDLIVEATFDNQFVSHADFVKTDSLIYGNCYTFNINDTERTRRALPGYGELCHHLLVIHHYQTLN